VVATVHIEPLGIYSHKVKSLKDLPDGAQVAVPNNVTNLSRALYLLQANGLITLKSSSANTLVTRADITENPHHLKIIEVEAPQLPRALDDAQLAIINGNYALQAGLVPSKDALALEQAKDNPYANVLVTTPKLAHDPRILELAKDLESKQTAEFINQHYKGSVIPVNQ
jgi:D-methionine transport system substrate-binding protein